MTQKFSTHPKIQALLEKSKELMSYMGVSELLGWDQEVMMPPKASTVRSHQVSYLAGVTHAKLTDQANQKLLDECAEAIQADPNAFSVYDKALVREFKRKFDKATKLPEAFVKQEAMHTSQAVEVWKDARAKNDFGLFQAALTKTIELARQKAEYLGYADSPYDALLDAYEPELTKAQVIAIFEPLKAFTTTYLKKIMTEGKKVDASILARSYAIPAQEAFNLQLAKGLNFDFEAGRLDKSTHPFTSTMGTSQDVRITTRYFETMPQASIMATIHEAGHALYEQGSAVDLDLTFLAGGVSLGVHESQSRMWENLVGRTFDFWSYWFPILQQQFSTVVQPHEQEAFVEALNKVEPSFIRVDADELTYNLHIILRFELESALLDGTLEVADLPQAWNEKMQTYLGVTPPDAALGVLQDIHWSSGYIGYFPTYTLGNLYATQLWKKIKTDLPQLQTQIRAGDYSTLLNWLRTNIHQHGATYPPAQLIKQVTGEALNPIYLQDYLKEKFDKIYF